VSSCGPQVRAKKRVVDSRKPREGFPERVEFGWRNGWLWRTIAIGDRYSSHGLRTLGNLARVVEIFEGPQLSVLRWGASLAPVLLSE
jgi:hypothetical protein